MKTMRILMIAVFVAFIGLGCSGGGGESTGEGGPDVTPAGVSVSEQPVTETSTDIVTDVDNQQAGTTGTADDTASTSGTGDDTGSSDEGTTGTGDSQQSSDEGTGQDTAGDQGSTSSSSDTASTSGTGTDTGSSDEGTTGTSDSQQSSDQGTGQDTASTGTGTGDDQGTSSTETGAGDETGSQDQAEGDQPVACPERTIALDASQGRWYQSSESKGKGKAKGQQAIYTNWENENLFLNVKNNCKAGWFKLSIQAGNHGDLGLPDNYKNFNITVRNEGTDRYLGGMLIKARDNGWQWGEMLVYLEEGDSQLNLLWTNDAYQANVYDANIEIKQVKLQYQAGSISQNNLVQNASQYSYLDGRFFWDADSARTNWANQTIGFRFNDLQPGVYEVVVTAKNYGTVPPGYSEFDVEVDTDNGISGEMRIPVSAENYQDGRMTLDLTGGDTTVYLTWLNDKYKENVYDANIQIQKIQLRRIGDSQRSALAAYLIAKAQNNKALTSILGAMVLVLGGLFVWNRKRMKQHQAV